jgi:hypothetical protein
MKNNRGSTSMLVLVLGVTISIAITGLVLLTAVMFTSQSRTESFEQSLSIAQAGAEYYRWHLNHDLSDYTDGTGLPGPYIHEIKDPFGNTDGYFRLTVIAPEAGSSVVTVKSEGWLSKRPDIIRTVTMKYGIGSFAKFSFFNNSNMWFGNRTEIHGPVFSNGGIRMDGVHDSTIESAKSTYLCGTETGCEPSQNKPGIWGEGGTPALWKFPSTTIDYNSIGLDFSAMKQTAIENGIYLPPSTDYGYHVIFSADGTFQVNKVTNAGSEKGWSVEGGCETTYQIIKKEEPVGNYQVSDKKIIFSENTLWVEGQFQGQMTVTAARFPLDINAINIWLPNSITYVAKDGTNNLGIIAQNDIIFALDIPNTLEINAALLAYKGKVLRHNYKYDGCKNASGAVKQQLIIYGSIVSNLKSYWSYGTGSGFDDGPTSGFMQRDIIYDSNLYYDPPPFFPTSGTYDIISWQEE